jgi:hypothetical protein
MNIGKYEFLGPAARSLRAPATFLRLLFRWIMWGIIGVFSLMFVLGVSGYIVVQTEWFHRWAAGQLTTILSDQLEARLSFGAVRFNLFRGVELDSVSLTNWSHCLSGTSWCAASYWTGRTYECFAPVQTAPGM